MYVAERYKWMKPYFRASKALVSKHRLAKVKSLRTIGIKDDQNTHAIARLTDNGDGTFAITICAYFRRVIVKGKKKIFTYSWWSRIDLLSHLAHEVAHLVHWDHTADHKALESDLMSLYMEMLKDSGYVSEEHEVANDDRDPPKSV